jgi:heat shock protein HspQ
LVRPRRSRGTLRIGRSRRPHHALTAALRRAVIAFPADGLTSPGQRAFKAQRAAGVLTAGVTVMGHARNAKFGIGQIVRHRVFPFRGVVFDVDPIFDNTEEWWLAIPEEVRPSKDQPYYHLFAENAESEYIAYVSEQNLLPDESGEPLRHPQISEFFERDGDVYIARDRGLN